jgi:hypothetical protein
MSLHLCENLKSQKGELLWHELNRTGNEAVEINSVFAQRLFKCVS